MTWSYKKILSIFVLCVLIYMPNKIFAWDCSFVDSDKEKQSLLNYVVVFPKEVFNRAVDNLRAYCCDKYSDNIIACKSANQVDDYPNSEYLYDHLLDIAFRRLDGFTWNYVYGMEPDIMWLEWRQFITKASKSITWDIAERIWVEYDKYRKLKYYKYDDNFLLNYNNLDSVSLTDKYYLICDILQDLVNKNFIWREKSDSDYYSKCRQLAYTRIENEDLYVKTIMIESSNQLLKSNFDAYLMKYFFQEKISSLKEKMVEFMNIFYTIFKQAPAAKSCSK